MGNMHPIFAAALAPFAPPPSINDDDIYVWDVRSKTIVAQYGAKSTTADMARRANGLALPAGQAWMTGMQLRHMQGERDE